MTCPACGDIRSTAPFRRSAPSLRRCTGCRSLFDTEPPTPATLDELYEGKSYFVKEDGDRRYNGYTDDYLADRRFIEAKFHEVLGRLERMAPPGRLLDVGAGPGFLVSVARQRGWDAIGIDMNAWAAAHARDELDVEVRVGTLDDDAFAGEQFDAITMMDVVEHVPDPDDLLRPAARLVRPGGAIALLTPDAGAPVSRLFGSRWWEIGRRGEHIVLFSRQGLAAALARRGFAAEGWHSVGKTTLLSTLVADAVPLAPALARRAKTALANRPIGQRVVTLDPRTKFCMYARRVAEGAAVTGAPVRMARRLERLP